MNYTSAKLKKYEKIGVGQNSQEYRKYFDTKYQKVEI